MQDCRNQPLPFSMASCHPTMYSNLDPTPEVTMDTSTKVMLYVLHFTPMFILTLLAMLITAYPQGADWKLKLLLHYGLISEAVGMVTTPLMALTCRVEASQNNHSPMCMMFWLSGQGTFAYKIIMSIFYIIVVYSFLIYNRRGKQCFKCAWVVGVKVKPVQDSHL